MTQQAEISRVRSNIADHVLTFAAARLGCEFHMAELEAYIGSFGTIAPGSGGRILRDLRRAGAVSYVVVSRAKSTYRITGVRKSQREMFA